MQPYAFDDTEESPVEQSSSFEKAKKYINSLRTQHDIDAFLNSGYHGIRRLFAIHFHVQYLAHGSSRVVFTTDKGTVLKVALDDTGIAQNASEVKDKRIRNEYGCFTRILWVSNNKLMIECEKADMLEGSDLEFEEITGIDFTKFFKYLKYNLFVNSVGSHSHYSQIEIKNMVQDDIDDLKEAAEEVTYELNAKPNTAKKALMNFAQYIFSHTSDKDVSIDDLERCDNWGKVKRNGEDVCVVVDYGASRHILNTYY